MRVVWQLALWFASSVAAGCAIRIPVDEPVWAVDRGHAVSHDPVLDALADAVDPGPQAPLRAGMPVTWLVGVDQTPAGEDPRVVAEQDLRVALLAWRESGPATGEGAVLAGLARAVARAEALASTGKLHPELMVTLLAVYAAIEAGGPDDRHAGLDDDAARRLLRHHAARLLRRHADHPGVPDVLTALADAAAREQDFTRAAELRQLAVQRLGERAGSESQLALASACYRALALACGDAARERAGQGGVATDEVVWLGEQARAALAPGTDELEARLERLHHLRALGRWRDAEAGYTAAIAAAPGDARPRVGLAGLALLRGDPDAALVHLQQSHALTHRDRSYHELAIALLWPRLHETGAARARALAELQVLAAGYRRFESARAEVLALLLASLGDGSTAPDALRAIATLGTRHAEVLALVRRFPDSADARRLAYMTAQLAPTAAAGLALVREPLTPALTRDRALRDLRLEAWFDLSVRWDRRAELPAIADAIAGLPTDAEPRGELLATTLAARATLAGEPVPAASRDIYLRLSETGAPQQRARALSNLAVLEVDATRPELAMQRWTAALAFDHAVRFIRVNLAGALVRHESRPRAEVAELLATLAAEAETDELELLALSWKFALAQKLGQRGDSERAALAIAWKAARAAQPGGAPLGLWGMISGPPRVALAYSDDRVRGHDVGGLTLTAEVDRVYWLMLSPHGRELAPL